MRDPLIRSLVAGTLEDVRRRIGSRAFLEDLVLPRFHPWMAAFVRYDDDSLGCGFSASVCKGMFAVLREDLVCLPLCVVDHGENAFSLVERFMRVEAGDQEEQVLVNAIALSVLSALSYKLLSQSTLETEGFRVREHSIGAYMLGHRIGMVLRDIVKPSDKIAVVGYAYWAFPYIASRVREFRCLELINEELFEVTTLSGAKPRIKVSNNAEKTLGDADIVMITGMTIPNETLSRILEYSRHARLRIMYGPSCSFYPKRLFEHGIDLVLAMKVPATNEMKQLIIDSRGLYPYENPSTTLLEIWSNKYA